MTAQLETCDKCAAPGAKWVAANCLCVNHANELLLPILERHITAESFDGIGRLVGDLQPHYGVCVGELQCDRCGATWSDRVGSACPWCEESAARLVIEQRDQLLDGPLPGEALNSWAARLAHGVLSGILEQHVARRRLEAVTRGTLAA